MEIKLYTDNIESYLKSDNVINYDNTKISDLANTLYESSESETDYIRKAYEYVRDTISHSADAGEDEVTCSAGEVLEVGHGICFAKSHLLAALLRAKSIPSGFCYQKLILDDETAPVLIYHGLNGVYIKEYSKWIRLDARGNKPGVNAQFSIDNEQLAFPIRPEKDEEDNTNEEKRDLEYIGLNQEQAVEKFIEDIIQKFKEKDMKEAKEKKK